MQCGIFLTLLIQRVMSVLPYKLDANDQTAAAMMPVSIDQTALLDRNITSDAKVTAAASRRPFCANTDATRAAITDTESASRNRSTFGETRTLLIKSAPASRQENVIAVITNIAAQAASSFGIEDHTPDAACNCCQNDIPASGHDA